MLIIKNILKWILFFIFYPIKYSVKKSNIVLLSGANDQVYCGNSRYLYEFLSNDPKLKVYYYTNSINVKNYLKLHNLSFISLSNPLALIIIMLRAKIIINAGDSYLNFFGITDIPSVYKICLNHGSGPKIESMAYDSFWDEHIKKCSKFDFVNFPSKYTVQKFGKELYGLPMNKIVSFGYPRCDQFYDKNIVQDASDKREYVDLLFNNKLTSNDKVILYTPTWRPYYYDLPILKMKDMNLREFNKWLIDNDFYFVYTNHLNEDSNKKYHFQADRIKMIDRNISNLFDINKLMMEIDILLNDYSTSSVDIAILDKPQIFFLPDANIYSKKDNFIEEYRSTMPGIEIQDYSSFIEKIKYIKNNKVSYLLEYKNKSIKLLEKYLYNSNIKSAEKFNQFINRIISL